MPDLKLAVVGATGAVGPEVLKVLEERNVPRNRGGGIRVRPLGRQAGGVRRRGSSRCGSSPPTRSKASTSRCSRPARAPRARSRPEAVARGCVVVDKSSAYRMDPDVPLVVPEVNAGATDSHNGIVANPNCSTIQFVAVLKPLLDAVGLEPRHRSRPTRP